MAERIRIGKEGAGRWFLVREGMGGFLDPPGAISHDWSLEFWRGPNSKEAEESYGLSAALGESYIPEPIKARIRAHIEAHDRPEMTEEWVRSVYAYFRHCYSPDGEDRNVSRCDIVKPNPDGDGYVWGTFGRDRVTDEPPPAERHLAYLCVREHFPDHTPRLDLIAAPPQWGSTSNDSSEERTT